MQEIHSSNPPVATGICDPNKSRVRHHRKVLIDLLKISDTMNYKILIKKLDYLKVVYT